MKKYAYSTKNWKPCIKIIKDKALKNGGFVGEFTEPSSGETLFQKAHILNKQIFPAAKGMLFLIRNPYDASIAEFKRIQGHGHTSVVNETIFKQTGNMALFFDILIILQLLCRL